MSGWIVLAAVFMTGMVSGMFYEKGMRRLEAYLSRRLAEKQAARQKELDSLRAQLPIPESPQ